MHYAYAAANPSERSGFSKAYHQYFEVITANTIALQEKAYRLRYEVYCCENQYENAEEHPFHMEMDAFDRRSIHSLLIHKASGIAIGTVRLILPDPKSREAELPVHQICDDPFLGNLPGSSTAEISRFAISKTMRKLVNGDLPANLRCSAIIGLMKAVVQSCLDCCITDCVAVMEPALLRILSSFNMHFRPIGPLVQHHGLRQPCHANVERLLSALYQENFEFWEFLTESMSLANC